MIVKVAKRQALCELLLLLLIKPSPSFFAFTLLSLPQVAQSFWVTGRDWGGHGEARIGYRGQKVAELVGLPTPGWELPCPPCSLGRRAQSVTHGSLGSMERTVPWIHILNFLRGMGK